MYNAITAVLYCGVLTPPITRAVSALLTSWAQLPIKVALKECTKDEYFSDFKFMTQFFLMMHSYNILLFDAYGLDLIIFEGLDYE